VKRRARMAAEARRPSGGGGASCADLSLRCDRSLRGVAASEAVGVVRRMRIEREEGSPIAADTMSRCETPGEKRVRTPGEVAVLWGEPRASAAAATAFATERGGITGRDETSTAASRRAAGDVTPAASGRDGEITTAASGRDAASTLSTDVPRDATPLLTASGRDASSGVRLARGSAGDAMGVVASSTLFADVTGDAATRGWLSLAWLETLSGV